MKREGESEEIEVEQESLIEWARKREIPHWVLDVFEKKELHNLESVGKLWDENPTLMIRLVRAVKIPIDQVLSNKLKKSLECAKDYYINRARRKKEVIDSPLNTKIKETIIVESPSLTETTSSFIINSVESTSTTADTFTNLSLPSQILTKEEMEITEEKEEKFFIVVPTSASPLCFHPDLQAWITQNNISAEIQQSLRNLNVLSLEELAKCSDDEIGSLGDKLKPIPLKKFLLAIKAIKSSMDIS
jgi:hypothetical protein|mmetsp:Transcript_29107/g.31725  ORF Transcript_29107/g.31725 Transcript_29107/m.31725 type:complete len:246 (-) Transcript_29107:140-877(-)|eukprot:CAMPEP_0173156776 /NCGR_PEP_ID=MMETSP1105-20130129/15089_1 /TAXON_ID=2985 /ORGANISM="Ochromonas sp., Strain BG-1" /LENGTH=245 /DNA_ID=CAMNT_0014073831 /DNA_START=110 /DNA_END=847 /DNA_ORIENTATION=+